MVLEGNPQRIKNACKWFCVNGPMRLVEIFMVNFDGIRVCVYWFFFRYFQFISVIWIAVKNCHTMLLTESFLLEKLTQ